VIQVAHPQYFKLQPVVKPITWQDWSITVTKFSDANTAQKLVALLNHQGPAIPSRTVQKNGSYHVVAGPYNNAVEVQSVIRNVKREFQFDSIAHPPQAKENSQRSFWFFGE
jgi:L,D-transpeptidase ErfK/SrfK